MGLKIPCRICAQIEEASIVRENTEIFGASALGTGRAEAEQDLGRAYGLRPCPYVDPNPAEICRVKGYWLPEGQKRDSSGGTVFRQEKELQRRELLGKGLYSIHSGI